MLRPILKWVGGKRQLLDVILPKIPSHISTYVEPFVGGGAVLLELQPKKAVINDSNSELINVYRCVKEHPVELIERLKEHQKKNSADYFYEIRGLDRDPDFQKHSSIERAARILYLNKTCYNGLYRVNAAGQFNSPYGKYKNPNIVNEAGINALSKYLNGEITILNGDYSDALKGLRRGAFVYLDPPYMPVSSSSSFTGYTENGFGYQEQERLRNVCMGLANKNIHFLQSNSDTPEIRELYKDFDIETVQAIRSVNSRADRRGAINEVLVYA
ncbi:Modification methylase DpnIIA [Scardovia inopinata]|uniref:Site-specific DNA-methyltransferase (adenine-specific) n=2 Tax=Scardovia inopinata TaxID=78259 RepID=W5IGG2_SCAIO|nr:DNA adenine methylase [Scardovia inopinata]EFG26006.2 DNA adenine methylase [Scardovia inopinata F0304]BAR07363.1 putative DNA methylase [Scardovia inopinata JCM 12537]SUV51440.1 Modification methylase DpnIIA [Scardovia inopinata]